MGTRGAGTSSRAIDGDDVGRCRARRRVSRRVESVVESSQRRVSRRLFASVRFGARHVPVVYKMQYKWCRSFMVATHIRVVVSRRLCAASRVGRSAPPQGGSDAGTCTTSARRGGPRRLVWRLPPSRRRRLETRSETRATKPALVWRARLQSPPRAETARRSRSRRAARRRASDIEAGRCRDARTPSGSSPRPRAGQGRTLRRRRRRPRPRPRPSSVVRRPSSVVCRPSSIVCRRP